MIALQITFICVFEVHEGNGRGMIISHMHPRQAPSLLSSPFPHLSCCECVIVVTYAVEEEEKEEKEEKERKSWKRRIKEEKKKGSYIF